MYFNLLEIAGSFTRLDENWNGIITMEELESVMKKSGKALSAGELKTVIAAMDKNGNTNSRNQLSCVGMT